MIASTLHQLHVADVATLLQVTTPSPCLTADHVASFAARLTAIASPVHRRIDAWSVEQGGSPSPSFAWSARTARRSIASAALHRSTASTVLDAVRDEIDDLLSRAVAGQAPAGSLAAWLSGCRTAELAVIRMEATNYASVLLEQRERCGSGTVLERSDAYCTVAGATTTLRGRRDLRWVCGDERVLLRVRPGEPGRSAGAGLRTDLFIATMSDPGLRAPQRFIGLWPDAGIALSVDGTVENLRAGARSVLGVATRQHQAQLAHVA